MIKDLTNVKISPINGLQWEVAANYRMSMYKRVIDHFMYGKELVQNHIDVRMTS